MIREDFDKKYIIEKPLFCETAYPTYQDLQNAKAEKKYIVCEYLEAAYDETGGDFIMTKYDIVSHSKNLDNLISLAEEGVCLSMKWYIASEKAVNQNTDSLKNFPSPPHPHAFTVNSNM